MGKSGVSIGIKLSVFVLFIILICSVGIGVFSYLEFHNSSIEDKKETSRLLAQSFASTIDGDLFEEIMASQEKNEYWNQVKVMADKVKTETDVMYLYVIDANYTQDEVRYFVTGFKPGDEITTDFLETDTLDLYGAEMFETLKTGQSLASDVYDGGIYGSMLSGYAAVLNSRGKVVGVVGVDISVDEAFAASRTFLWDIAVFALVFCVVFIIAGIIFMNRVITHPLKRLSQASRKIANGEISVNFGIYSRDEIGQLSSDLIKLAENLNMLTNRINETTQAHNKGNIHTLIKLDGFSGVYLQVAEGINNMASQYVKDITSMLTVIRAFGMGDFNASLEDMPGEKKTINDAVEGLRKNLGSVSDEVLSLVRHAESGNLSVQIDSGKFDGDWKRLALSLNSLLIAVAKPMKEATLVLEKMSEGDLNVRMTGDYEGDFEKIKLSLNKMSSNISHYISEIEISLDKAAHNDFSASIHSDFVGHFGNIKISVNRIIEHLGIVFGTLGKNLKETSQGIMTDSANLAVSGSNLADNSSSQSKTIEILKAKIESISEQIGDMTQNTALANELSLQSKRGADEGKSQMQILLDTMNDINESSLNILKVISVIEGIAFQTNLLALNASVEAARAGTHGKGFAVVAEEVRNLAARSKDSAKDSSDLIHASIDKIKEGVRMAMETDGELNKIVNNVESVYKYIDEIAKSSEEQKFNIEDIANGIKSLHSAVSNSSTSSQEVAAIAAKLSEEADELNGLLLKMQ